MSPLFLAAAPFTHWIHTYGYFALGGLLAVGIAGLPVPDEVVLAYAGVLASRGELGLAPAILAATLGSWCGITASFAIGKTGGHWVLKWLAGRSPAIARRSERALAWFNRGGRWFLAASYFVPGLRHVTVLVAGALGLPVHEFMLFAYPGGIVWVSTFILLGYALGNQWVHMSGQYHRYVLAGAAILGGAACGTYAAILVRRRRRDP